MVFVVEIFNIVSDSLRRDSKACGDSRRDKGRIDQLNTWISDFCWYRFLEIPYSRDQDGKPQPLRESKVMSHASFLLLVLLVILHKDAV